MNEEENQPNEGPDNEPVWDEYDWERFLREQDLRAERYLELMETYRDHPDRDNIVAREMGWHHLVKECNDPNPKCDGCSEQWRCNYFQNLRSTNPQDPGSVEDLISELLDQLIENQAEELWFPEGDDEEPDEEGDYDPDAFQEDPLYQEAFSLGLWIRHFFTSLPAAENQECVVRLISYALVIAAKVAAAIGDGEFDEIGMSIAYLKRGLRTCNLCLESLQEIERKEIAPPYGIEKARRKIFAVRDGIVSLLGECREEWQRRYGRS